MAKLRKWCAYKKIERPYTRWSKTRGKAFVKSRPGKKVIKFDMGNLKKGEDNFDFTLDLISKDSVQVRVNAIEAARIGCLRKIDEELGLENFYLKIRCFPHHTLRENKLAAGAGADRLSTGMKHSFGKTIGTAAQVKKGKILFSLSLDKSKEAFGREMLKRASKKLPLRTTIQVRDKK